MFSSFFESNTLKAEKKELFTRIFLFMSYSKLGVQRKSHENNTLLEIDSRMLKIFFMYGFFAATKFGNMSARFPEIDKNKKHVLDCFYNYLFIDTLDFNTDTATSEKYDNKKYVDDNGQFNIEVDCSIYVKQCEMIAWFHSPDAMSEDSSKIEPLIDDDLFRFNANPKFYFDTGIPALYEILSNESINP
jgi:hypothetical protein